MAWTAHVEPNDFGYFPCAACDSEYVTPLAAATCCDSTYDDPDLED